MKGNMDDTGMDAKQKVHDFWNQASCGENLLLPKTDCEGYRAQSEERYRLEPFIPPFADFPAARGRRVLEIGVGLGADHQRFAESGALLSGIDLTERAVEHTRRRLALFGLSSELAVGDAERLSFEDATFDIVYSWGVLHHSPDTPRAVAEVHRVLKPGGKALIMVYHKWSMVGAMLWIRYALLAGRPWRGLRSIYAEHLESPGTKAYSYPEARDIFSRFSSVAISTPLSHGDLLDSEVGQRHRGLVLRIAKSIWPRWLICRILPRAGLFMLIEAVK
jgi:SAM-dependent methyltransferase